MSFRSSTVRRQFLESFVAVVSACLVLDACARAKDRPVVQFQSGETYYVNVETGGGIIDDMASFSRLAAAEDPISISAKAIRIDPLTPLQFLGAEGTIAAFRAQAGPYSGQ